MVTSNYSDQGESRAQDNIQQIITRAGVGDRTTKDKRERMNGQVIDLGFLFIIVFRQHQYYNGNVCTIQWQCNQFF